MQQSVSKDYLINLIGLLPSNESNTAKSFLEFLIAKENVFNKNKKKKETKDEFDRFVEYLETLPYGEPLTKREKKTVEKARIERKNNEYFTLDELLNARSEKLK